MRFYHLFAFALPAATAAQTGSTGASFIVNGTHYFVSPFASGQACDGYLNIAGLKQTFGLTPVTVVSEQVSPDSLGELFAEWGTKDDVWQPAFLSTVLARTQNKSCITKSSFHPEVDSYIAPLYENSTASIPSGPYFLDLSTCNVHKAYRLYDDFSGAFTSSVLQRPDEKFQPLSAQLPSSASLTIGVPSRLYYTRTEAKPLAGVRIAVKDLFDLAGVRKSNGNRAWWHLYPAPNKTAVAIQNLIDAGAVIIGTQKLSQFANGATPTADWVDYHGPFNARGDGYNDPSSSSAGAGAGISSYEWLDIAVGSDTGGSVRWPAAAVGSYGNRPSRGLVSLEGAMPMSPTLDTPGLLLRDPSLWDAANQAMFRGNYISFSQKKVLYPKTVLTMGFPNTSTPTGHILQEFADRMGKLINAEVKEFDLFQAWEEAAPEGVDRNLEVFGNLSYTVLVSKEQIPLVREPFFRDYAAEHQGRVPFVDPSSKVRWDWGDAAPDSWLEDARRNKTLFGDWWNSKIQPRSSNDAECTSNLILYPGAVGSTPSPRNTYLKPPGPPLGWFTGLISCFADSPDSVFPLGEVAVPSTITGKDEMLPVTVDVLAAKGCDGVLARLATDLVEAGILSVPLAGRTLAGGSVLF